MENVREMAGMLKRYAKISVYIILSPPEKLQLGNIWQIFLYYGGFRPSVIVLHAFKVTTVVLSTEN